MFHELSSVVGSALRVIGNIMRWGNSDQIEIITKGCLFGNALRGMF